MRSVTYRIDRHRVTIRYNVYHRFNSLEEYRDWRRARRRAGVPARLRHRLIFQYWDYRTAFGTLTMSYHLPARVRDNPRSRYVVIAYT